MKTTKEYRIARLIFLHNLMTDIADLEPKLIDMTDWHTNSDALQQMLSLIENGEV
jgi:hypothetical protein